MRLHHRALVLAVFLVLPVAALAKPTHQPVSCPTDVDTALAAACPCPGTMLPDGSVTPWRNHGQYVRCVIHARNAFRKGGCLSPAQRSVANCAARSTCGKANEPIICCVPVTCSDTTPGDGMKQGVCSNDPALACDVATDCTGGTGGGADDTSGDDGSLSGWLPGASPPTLIDALQTAEIEPLQTVDVAACTALGGTPGTGSMCNPCVTPAP